MTESLDHWGIINRLFGPLTVEYCFLFDIMSKLGFLGVVATGLTNLYILLIEKGDNWIYLITGIFLLIHYFLMFCGRTLSKKLAIPTTISPT